LFETIIIDLEQVKHVVREHWDIELGALIKASQNHTFNATQIKSGSPVIVRVTPDPRKEQRDRIELELSLLHYLYSNYPMLSVCASIPSLGGKSFVMVGDLIFVVFEFAKGSPVVWSEYHWMTNKEIVGAWGKWFGHFHVASREFTKTYPDLVSRARPWTKMHQSVMEGSPIHPEDEKLIGDPHAYGLLHGDLNCSNFFFDDRTKSLCVFDWDQIQVGWFLYDLSQAIFGVVMLAGGGNPHGQPVDFADVGLFTDWLVEGYESVPHIEKVDRKSLERMVALKKLFYYRFCKQAVVELKEDEERAGILQFCQFVVDWIDSQDVKK